MSLLNIIGIGDALAAATDAPGQQHTATGGLLSMLPMLLLFIVVFYFLLVRPQTKRAKEHKKLMNELSLNDEVLTNGGIIGRLTQVKDGFLVINVSKGVDITIQKSAVVSVLPKGTLDSMQH